MRSRRERGRDRESGVTVIEFLLLTPILFILMFGTIEFGLVLYARHVAVAAAQEGARVAREQAFAQPDSWQGTASRDATDWVTRLVGGLVKSGVDTTPTPRDPSIPAGAVYPEVGMTVEFQVVTVVPWSFDVTATSVGPVECFYTPQGTCDGG